MKKAIYSLLLLYFVYGNGIVAQIYVSAQDYKQGKPSFSCDSLQANIRFYHLFSRNYVVVQCKGKKYKLSKDSIWGYANSRHETFRFYKSRDEEYKIVDTGKIILYSYPIMIWSSNGRFIKAEQHYFFSKTIDSPILPLTLIELKRAFPESLKFHDMLDLQFENVQTIREGDFSKIKELTSKYIP